MTADLGLNAEEVFAGFVRVLTRCLSEQTFDLILAAGDSGSAMAGFAQLVYEEVGLSVPPVVLLPVFQRKDSSETEFRAQEHVLIELARQQLHGVRPQNVLVLDDEIRDGNAVGIALAAVRAATGAIDQHVVLLAEDQGFTAEKLQISGVVLNFRPFSVEHDGISNAIFWFIPFKYQDPVKLALRSVVSGEGDRDKWPMLLLLNAPVKLRVNGKPEFSHEIHQKVLALEPNLPKLQRDFQELVRRSIRQAMASAIRPA